ncbi:carboxy-S-adenosyl-L-methionine synthase CmoA [Halopseudomonas xiamenensis]|uniref:carboxy-S-adenosyl-L-methionine synthase CmoA n=1 Tax=Halopseudomonas xiamenensis TaxID=157792 RepID=UPI0016277322|nr:carboxy-S-adenosyl-L-methionine synthase CmoA [Halopseudomonas xiamenensis]
MTDVDKLFAAPLPQVSDFVFDHNVARVFPDMIKRSIPGYPTIVENIGVIAAQYAQPNTLIYDLGCSLGAATQSMRRHLRSEGCRIIAVDNAEAMTQRCQEYLSAQDSMIEELVPASVVHGDILELELQPCSVVVMNFTLQFIAPERRLKLLSSIRQALLPGGVLILSEKFRFTEPAVQHHLEQVHWAFKRANGYSDLEIAQKRSAIENIMLLDTPQAHLERLQAAGFSQAYNWFQCFNFGSIMAHA